MPGSIAEVVKMDYSDYHTAIVQHHLEETYTYDTTIKT